MQVPPTKLRGTQKRMNLEYAVCALLALAFFVALVCVVSLFSGAAADTQTLDDRAGISSSERAQKGAEALNSQSASAGGSTAATTAAADSASAQGSSAAAVASAGNSSADSGAIGRFGTTEAVSETTASFGTLGEKHNLAYMWNNAPQSSVSLYNEAGSRVFLFLPDSEEIRAGNDFFVNANYPAGYTVYTMERAANSEVSTQATTASAANTLSSATSTLVKTGKYTFSGWSVQGMQTMPDEDMVIFGTWTYEKIDSTSPDGGGDGGDKDKGDGDEDDKTVKHKVTYSWEGLLQTTVAEYVDENGMVVITNPPNTETVEEGKAYTIDTTWKAGTKLYFKDKASGTLQREYTFSGWQIDGAPVEADVDQTMGTQDVSITGTWTSTLITHSVKFEWFTDYDRTYPAAGTTLYKNFGADNQSSVVAQLPETMQAMPTSNVQFDAKYEIDTDYAELGEDGSVKRYWTFHGWTSEDVQLEEIKSTNKISFTVGNTDITIYGEWTWRDAGEEAGKEASEGA